MWGGAVNTRMVIHVPVYELPRITIPRTSVNRGSDPHHFRYGLLALI
jgi:hypothetical protein